MEVYFLIKNMDRVPPQNIDAEKSVLRVIFC
jgi:hypothetical protein